MLINKLNNKNAQLYRNKILILLNSNKYMFVYVLVHLHRKAVNIYPHICK